MESPSVEGAAPLLNQKHEKFAFLLSCGLPALQCAREAGYPQMQASNARKLAQNPKVRARVGHWARQEAEVLAEKRRRIEARQWIICEANIRDYYEVVVEEARDKDGNVILVDDQPKMRRYQRPRLFADLPPEMTLAIEGEIVTDSGKRNYRFYSAMDAGKTLRAMNGIDRAPESGGETLSGADALADLVVRINRIAGKIAILPDAESP